MKNLITSIKFIQDLQKITLQQFLVFYSVYLWVKKTIDIRIPDDKFNDFIKFCEKYNLYYKYDVKFVDLTNFSYFKKVIGNEILTTTKTIWVKISDKRKWSIHFFVWKNKDDVEWAYNYWWYPVVIWNRVIPKPYHDLLEFWYYLGYPSCCRKFFMEKNDWRYYNFPYEIYKNSGKFDYRCNWFWKDFLYSPIYHMPCSYSCEKTIEYTEKILYFVKKEDPYLYKDIVWYLKLPVLSVREKVLFAFEWHFIDNHTIWYNKIHILWDTREDRLLHDNIVKWNKITIKNNIVYIFFNDKLIYQHDCSLSDEIEIPHFINFN